MTDQSRSGSVSAVGPEALPDSFGNVTGEYLALRRGCGLVGERWEVVWVEGPGAVSFLQGLLSADVEALASGRVSRSFLLTPRGMVRFLLWVLKDDVGLGLVCDRGIGADLAETLDYYRIRVKAEIRLDPRPISSLVGPACSQGTVEEGRWERNGEELAASAPLAGLPRVFLAGAAPAGAIPAGEIAWRAVRVESGEPVVGRDLDERTIPQETGGLAQAAVSFTKGCFLGQELVARIDSRGGRVNRTLRGLEVRTNILPPEGAEVWRGEKVVGRITSVAESLEVAAPVGLSLIRRGTGPGDEVMIRWEGGDAPALVRALPLVDASHKQSIGRVESLPDSSSTPIVMGRGL